MVRDVEKNWHDPAALRMAIWYVVAVVAVAGLIFAAFAIISSHPLALAIAVPTTLFLGGVIAFVKAYRVWRAEGTWVIWQGAGWFLLTLMLICLSIPGAAILG